MARVDAPAAGFVVLLEQDDDRPVAERPLGTAPVPAGSSTDVVEPLDPVLTAAAGPEAARYADTDGDGASDPADDQPVPEPDSDENEDDADAEHRVG